MTAKDAMVDPKDASGNARKTSVVKAATDGAVDGATFASANSATNK